MPHERRGVKRTVRANWRATVMLCAKSQKRLHGGFGPDGKQTLGKLLRKRAGGSKGRKAAVGVIETGCLKICPKHAVVAVRGDRPAEWLLIRPDEPIEAIEARLGLAPLSLSPLSLHSSSRT